MPGPAALAEAPVFDRPPVWMAEVTSMELVRRQAEEPIGNWAVHALVENPSSPEDAPKIGSLKDAIKQAAAGSQQAELMIGANALAEITEITLKDGHVRSVKLNVDEYGRQHQYGQTMQAVHENTLRLVPKDSPMRPRSEAEAANTLTIESALQRGDLKDNWAVVVTRAPGPKDMTIDEAKEEGFFTETMTFILQASTECDEIIDNEPSSGKKVEMELAFMAGIPSEGEDRQDEAMVITLGDFAGADLRGLSVTETMSRVILIPKWKMPNGVTDLAQVIDKEFGTFMGKDQPVQDYDVFKQTCKEREEMLQPKADAVVAQLIAESETIQDDLYAIQRLHKLAEKEMVQQAFFDRSIDPRVFGPAAPLIEEGRRHIERGDYRSGLALVDTAVKIAKSDSCPSGVKSDSNEPDANSENDTDCTFVSKECPECGKKNVKTKVSFSKITKLRRVSGSCKCVKYYKE